MDMMPMMPDAGRVPVPGEAEARGVADAARAREADLAGRIADAERERREAVEARSALASRLAAGEDVTGAALKSATAAVGSAEATIALLQDALRVAEGATKRAETALVNAMRSEIRRRAPAVRIAAAAAEARQTAAQEESIRLFDLSNEMQRTVVGPLTEADCEYFLAQSADFASAEGVSQ